MTIIDPYRPVNYSYEQIIWASTQKSINTGSSGFGLRTHSPGISSEEASEIVQEAMVNYSLPTAQKATESDIVENPLIEDRYPSLYTFREVTLRNGNKYWVVGRTLYVVSDYGFFADIDSARRDGSNYIAHLAIFREKPDISILYEMIRQDKFLPVDKHLTPFNTEIRDLLVGDPKPLPTGNISYVPYLVEGEFLTEVALALLTAMYRNEHPSDDGSIQPKKIVVRLDDNRLKDLIYTFKQLPQKLYDNLQFQANTLYYTGVPENLDMIVVPHQNTTHIDEEFFIVADYSDTVPKTRNIHESPLFDKIRDTSETGIVKRADTILFCTEGGLNESDPEFAFWVRMIIKDKFIPRPGEVSLDNLRKLLKINSLSYSDKEYLDHAVNRYLNSYFQPEPFRDYKANTLREGLDILNVCLDEAPDLVKIDYDSIDFLSERLFAHPDYLNRLFRDSSQNHRLEAALYILNEADIKVPHDKVMDSLMRAENPEVWRQMLAYSPDSGNPSYPLDVMRSLLTSPVIDKASLIKDIFDPVRYKNSWIIASETLDTQSLRQLGFMSIVDEWLKRPGAARAMTTDGTAAQLLAKPELLSPAANQELRLASDIASKMIPEVMSVKALSEAFSAYGPHDPYTEDLVRIWLEMARTEEDFISHLGVLKGISSTREIARWFEKYSWPHITKDKNRERAVILIMDKVLKGNKDDIIIFSESVSDKEIPEIIQRNSGFGASLKRKFSGLFGKK